MLDARSEAIEGSINSAEAAQAEAQAALEKYTAQLADARAEAGRIREQARADGSPIIAELREQASSEAARITSNAQAQIEMERLAALASLQVGRGQPRARPGRRRDRRDALRGRQGAGRGRSLPRRARGVREGDELVGSATTQALAATTTALDAASSVDLDTARELFAAARIVGDSPQLSGALADPSASPAARSRVVTDVFGAAFGKTTLSLLTTAVEQRWSSASQLVDGIEELAVRAAAISAPGVDVDGELFSASRLVADNPEIELALGSRLGDDTAKGALIETLLRGRASDATILIVSSLVQQPRERRVRQLLSQAMDLVADQRGSIVATVVTATPLNAGAVRAARARSSRSATARRSASTRSSTPPSSEACACRSPTTSSTRASRRGSPTCASDSPARHEISRPGGSFGASAPRNEGTQWQN